MPPISLLIKPASGSCNMRCDYCFYCDEAGKRTTESFGFMEEKTLKNVIRKFVLAAEGSCTIAFQGGEPTLRGLGFFRKVIDYVNQYDKKGRYLATYSSVRIAGEINKIDESSISNVLAGRRKSTYGYKWKFAD